MSLVLMSPYHMWYQGSHVYFVITRTWQFLVHAVIPCTLILVLNCALYKKLGVLQSSEDFKMFANAALRKSILRVRLALSISLIFVISQILLWLPLLYDVSTLKHSNFRFKSNSIFFQIIFWTPKERFDNTVLEKGHIRKTIKASGNLIYVINGSANFFVYKYLQWKENKVAKQSKRPTTATFYVETSTTSMF